MSAAQTSRILDYTVLPFRLTARAWIDPVFRAELLRNPRTFLVECSDCFSRGSSYLILEDTPSLRYYTIPYLSQERISELGGNLLPTLEEEMGEGTSTGPKAFEFWLPTKVIHRALTDPEYLAQLNQHPISLLKGEGYSVSCDIRVIQNAPTTCHIPLRFNHHGLTRFDEALLVASGDELPFKIV